VDIDASWNAGQTVDPWSEIQAAIVVGAVVSKDRATALVLGEYRLLALLCPFTRRVVRMMLFWSGAVAASPWTAEARKFAFVDSITVRIDSS